MNKIITARDECLKICEAIWSCENDEQKQGCYNMFATYKKKHGLENIGITFIEIELLRLEKLIVKLNERQLRQNELMKKVQKERAEELEVEENLKVTKEEIKK